VSLWRRHWQLRRRQCHWQRRQQRQQQQQQQQRRRCRVNKTALFASARPPDASRRPQQQTCWKPNADFLLARLSVRPAAG